MTIIAARLKWLDHTRDEVHVVTWEVWDRPSSIICFDLEHISRSSRELRGRIAVGTSPIIWLDSRVISPFRLLLLFLDTFRKLINRLEGDHKQRSTWGFVASCSTELENKGSTCPSHRFDSSIPRKPDTDSADSYHKPRIGMKHYCFKEFRVEAILIFLSLIPKKRLQVFGSGA